jgi:hypothetical protein
MSGNMTQVWLVAAQGDQQCSQALGLVIHLFVTNINTNNINDHQKYTHACKVKSRLSPRTKNYSDSDDREYVRCILSNDMTQMFTLAKLMDKHNTSQITHEKPHEIHKTPFATVIDKQNNRFILSNDTLDAAHPSRFVGSDLRSNGMVRKQRTGIQLSIGHRRRQRLTLAPALLEPVFDLTPIKGMPIGAHDRIVHLPPDHK